MIDNSQVMPKNSEGDLDDIDMMEDLEISNVTLTKPANSKAKGVMAGRPEVMTVNMELSQPSGFDLDPLVE